MDEKTIKRPYEPVYGALNLEYLPPGHIIDDRYEIREKLGQGGFGAVYRASGRSMELDRRRTLEPTDVAFIFTWRWPTLF